MPSTVTALSRSRGAWTLLQLLVIFVRTKARRHKEGETAKLVSYDVRGVCFCLISMSIINASRNRPLCAIVPSCEIIKRYLSNTHCRSAKLTKPRPHPNVSDNAVVTANPAPRAARFREQCYTIPTQIELGNFDGYICRAYRALK